MNLANYLSERNISIYTLSKNSGVPYATCYNLAKGKSDVEECRVSTIRRIASALGVSPSEIIDGTLPAVKKHLMIRDSVSLDPLSLPSSLRVYISELERLDEKGDSLFYAMAESMLTEADREEHEGLISRTTLEKLYLKYPTE
jgi:DNA-binding Xre family transcriptional regulator